MYIKIALTIALMAGIYGRVDLPKSVLQNRLPVVKLTVEKSVRKNRNAPGRCYCHYLPDALAGHGGRECPLKWYPSA